MRNSYKGIEINCAKGTHKEVFNLIKNDTDSLVVDIPSGYGAFILRLKDNGYKNIKAIDIENILKIEHGDFSVGDMTKDLPMKDGSVDSFICIDGIEHIDEQFHFIKEITRVLKTNGELIISTPNISSIRSRWRWLMTGHHNKCKSPLNENNPTPLHHIGMISFSEIRYLLHTSGLVIEEISTNRIKPINWLYSIIIPFSFVYTTLTYMKTGRKENTKTINQEIKIAMFSLPILFGETLIIRAVKK
ncbi:MAG: class I SAM-dependent methyltransferase [Gammaproteobacteria bacterium]|nr:class I SAM-dependent methyltransferase [Gammaproteobacteria bacterium]